MFADALMSKLDFRDPAPEVVDLSPKDGLVASFQESKVECLTKEKVYFVSITLSLCLDFTGHLPILFFATIPRTIISVPICN